MLDDFKIPNDWELKTAFLNFGCRKCQGRHFSTSKKRMEKSMLERRKEKSGSFPVRQINTWSSMDDHQPGDIPNQARKMLYCAGQVSTDSNGNLLYPGDMKKQMLKSLENLEKALSKKGIKLKDVVEITYYATDVASFAESSLALMQRLAKAGCMPATALIGVSSLFHPDCLVEFEALAFINDERNGK